MRSALTYEADPEVWACDVGCCIVGWDTEREPGFGGHVYPRPMFQVIPDGVDPTNHRASWPNPERYNVIRPIRDMNGEELP